MEGQRPTINMSSKEYKELEKEEFIKSQEEEYLFNQYLISEALKIQQGADRIVRMVTERIEYPELDEDKTEEAREMNDHYQESRELDYERQTNDLYQ